jgi:hypothetical protein
MILLLYVLQSFVKGPFVFDICHFEFIHLRTIWRGVMLEVGLLPRRKMGHSNYTFLSFKSLLNEISVYFASM